MNKEVSTKKISAFGLVCVGAECAIPLARKTAKWYNIVYLSHEGCKRNFLL